MDRDRRLGSLTRLALEYRYLPGLRLTTPQAARLCGLSIGESDTVLTALVASGYLYCDRSGRYARVDIDAHGCDVDGVAAAVA